MTDGADGAAGSTSDDSDGEIVWSNWSGRHVVRSGRLHHVRSEDDAAALAADAAANGLTVRPAGAGHSHQPLIPNDHVIADMSGMTGVISTDPGSQRAWVWAGTPIYALGHTLRQHGLALHNQGDIDRQFIGGAAGTGTHGTGHELTNLSAAVTGAQIALSTGELVTCSATERPELWQAARLSLGALGIITRLELQLRPAYKLAEVGTYRPWAEVEPDLAELQNATRHYEFFWMPDRDLVVAKAISETDADPEYPLAREGKRVGWNYEVLPNSRTWPHTELEYSIPAESGPEAFAAVRAMVQQDFPDMPWPLEYRTLAADDVWMSTAYERPTVTISLHQDINEDETPMFRAAEEILRAFDGRPHWGKVHYLDGQTLEAIHPRWSDWWTVRDDADPSDTFLNEHLRSIRTVNTD